jgi:hypothetical protein
MNYLFHLTCSTRCEVGTTPEICVWCQIHAFWRKACGCSSWKKHAITGTSKLCRSCSGQQLQHCTSLTTHHCASSSHWSFLALQLTILQYCLTCSSVTCSCSSTTSTAAGQGKNEQHYKQPCHIVQRPLRAVAQGSFICHAHAMPEATDACLSLQNSFAGRLHDAQRLRILHTACS